MENAIDHDADLEARDSQGRTLLHRAVALGKVQLAEMLLVRRADPNAAVRFGATPLLLAVKSNNADKLVSLLLQYGADISSEDANGRNILYYLTEAVGERVELARCLLRNGAPVNGSSYHFMSRRTRPLQIAIHLKKYQLVSTTSLLFTIL